MTESVPEAITPSDCICPPWCAVHQVWDEQEGMFSHVRPLHETEGVRVAIEQFDDDPPYLAIYSKESDPLGGRLLTIQLMAVDLGAIVEAATWALENVELSG